MVNDSAWNEQRDVDEQLWILYCKRVIYLRSKLLYMYRNY